MKYQTIWIYLLLVLEPFWAQAQALTDAQAQSIASAYLQTTETAVAAATDAYCIVQCATAETKGYVIVDKRPDARRRIIGYAPGGRWLPGSMPPALTQWLAGLSYMRRAPRRAAEDDENENEEDNGEDEVEREDVLPLLTCHWHQSSPYNDLSPVITDGNVKTAAGCVAIAAAQVAYYWREWLPESTLCDTPTYPYGAAPVTRSIPAGTPNRWELMRDDYDGVDDEAARATVAQLTYVIGTTSYLNYASSTGGQISEAATALYLQYRLTSEWASKAMHEQDEWEQLLYDDLAQGCPIIYAGNMSGSGHAVVIDGYDSALALFHFNFGWGGLGDGYYTVDDETGMNGYNRSQTCVHRIIPEGYQTAIRQPRAAPQLRAIYDISGRRIAPTLAASRLHKGVYIINGKKIVVHD